jgi:nucleotide-binding universal stress UspA family protein
MNGILVASDLSARSDRALARGFALARELGAKLQVLHVVDADLPPELRAHSVDWARRTLTRETQTLGDATGVKAALEVVAARPAPTINARADACNADVLVLGVHNATGSGSRDFSQTTAGIVLKDGHLPMLLVKEEARQRYRQVVIGVDFSVYSRAAILQAFRIAPSACFHLLHAYHVPYRGFLGGQGVAEEVAYERRLQFDGFLEEEMGLLGRRAAEVGIPADAIEKVLREGEPRQVLHAECGRVNADLVVIGTHGRTGASRAVFGSVAADILNAPPCDVLVARAY